MRRERFFDREEKNISLCELRTSLDRNKDIKKRWDKSEAREAELALGELVSSCDSSISTYFPVSCVVDRILNTFLLNLWRSI